mmetsp:Transcript_33011/g.106787  ORF Transcript_33011/g.106787 Transcript_33011/m.106787 type:complete len:406 (-) Transcript_33011:815-2032(-)|eukprot:scaffold4809_cov116-Isochrysis_galbana.AAC.3
MDWLTGADWGTPRQYGIGKRRSKAQAQGLALTLSPGRFSPATHALYLSPTPESSRPPAGAPALARPQGETRGKGVLLRPHASERAPGVQNRHESADKGTGSAPPDRLLGRQQHTAWCPESGRATSHPSSEESRQARPIPTHPAQERPGVRNRASWPNDICGGVPTASGVIRMCLLVGMRHNVHGIPLLHRLRPLPVSALPPSQLPKPAPPWDERNNVSDGSRLVSKASRHQVEVERIAQSPPPARKRAGMQGERLEVVLAGEGVQRRPSRRLARLFAQVSLEVVAQPPDLLHGAGDPEVAAERVVQVEAKHRGRRDDGDEHGEGRAQLERVEVLQHVLIRLNEESGNDGEGQERQNEPMDWGEGGEQRSNARGAVLVDLADNVGGLPNGELARGGRAVDAVEHSG